MPLRSLLLNALYPRVCPGCREPASAIHPAEDLCAACYGKLERLPAHGCPRCGEPFPSPAPLPGGCGNCRDRDLAFTEARTPFLSRGLVRDLIHRFKYGRQLHLCSTLGSLLAGEEETFTGIEAGRWVVVPVPLHGRRRRERGFNQAAELARETATRRRLPLVPALRRTRYTTTQTAHGRRRRIDNLAGAFALRPGRRETVRGRPVALLDDVLTTGATADACARVLREDGGAEKVVVITLARG